MEHIEFKYTFNDNGETKELKVCKCNEDGIHDYDACEMFLDFMKSAGFSEENVLKYFKE